VQIGSKLFGDRLPTETMSDNFTENFTKLFYLDLLELDRVEGKTTPNDKLTI
jgi:hypothetical protein